MKTIAALAFGAATLLGGNAARAACLGRPTDADFDSYSYDGAETASHAMGRVRVHWATSGSHAPQLTSTKVEGVPDSVVLAADVGQAALAAFAALGFAEVPGDLGCPSNGGDDKVDIYLLRFAAADGATRSECSGGVCSSFVLVDSKFTGGSYATAEEGFRTVVTHELFHAVQNVYRERDDAFWSEGTAQWAMKTLHPDLGDFERQLPAFFVAPSRALGATSGVASGILYGSAVWPLFLALRHGPAVIRETFEEERATGATALPAIDAVLSRRSSSLAAEYPLFALWNAATGALGGAGGYPDAASYPGVALAELADGAQAITSGLASFGYRGVVPAGQVVTLETDAARNAGWLVPVEAGKAQVDRAEALAPSSAAVGSDREVVVVVGGTTIKKTDAPFTLRLISASVRPVPADEASGCAASPRRGGICGILALVVLLGVARLRRR